MKNSIRISSMLLLAFATQELEAFQMMSSDDINNSQKKILSVPNQRRRRVLQAGGGGILSGLPFFGSGGVDPAVAATTKDKTGGGPTNEVVKVVNGIKHRRLGGSDIVVSEIGLGAQRWVSADFNAPNKDLCYQFMDEAILKRGVNLIDTAEQCKPCHLIWYERKSVQTLPLTFNYSENSLFLFGNKSVAGIIFLHHYIWTDPM